MRVWEQDPLLGRVSWDLGCAFVQLLVDCLHSGHVSGTHASLHSVFRRVLGLSAGIMLCQLQCVVRHQLT